MEKKDFVFRKTRKIGGHIIEKTGISFEDTQNAIRLFFMSEKCAQA